MSRAAPWACYAGHKLHDGDCIKTGDGKAGVVHLDPKGDSMFEQWSVKFRDESVPLFNAIDGLKIELDNIDHKSGAGSSVRYMSEADEIAEYSESEGGPWFQNLIDRIENAGGFVNNLVSSEQLAYVLNKSTKTIKHSLRRMQRDNRVEIVETKKEKTAHIGRFSDVFYMKPECAMTLVKSSRRSKEKADVIKHYEKTGEIKPMPEKFIEKKKVEKEQRINKFKSKRTEFPPLKTEYVVWMFGGQAQFVGATKIPTSEVESFGEYVPDHHLPAIYKILDSDAK